jgi:hypothetical protein
MRSTGRTLSLYEALHPTDRAIVQQTGIFCETETRALTVSLDQSLLTHTIHVMDTAVVEREARAAGLEVVCSYYTDKYFARFPRDRPTPDDFRTHYLECQVELRKPLPV